MNTANNLRLGDFRCRFLAVDDIWIPMAESMAIECFKPVWNCLLEGFGEDYGAFSSSCPGYGKHHSGDVEVAFSKSISCSLSSKGCKHR